MTVSADGRHGDTKGPGFWLLPEYADVCYFARTARVVFTAAATAAEAVEQLRELAAELAANGLAGGSPTATPIGEETEFRRETFVARLEPLLTAEVAALLLNLAVNQVRRAGLPKREEWLVMTDPFKVEERALEITQFNLSQQARALALLEQMTWGDMDGYIRGMEEALRLALEATSDDFYRWEDEIGPPLEASGYDEFSLPEAVFQGMPTEEKLAYVARLLRSLALHYGVSAEFGGARTGLVGEAQEVSPAALLRGLNDILWMPTTADAVE